MSIHFNIVIPTYNRPELIIRSVKSILSQEYKNCKVYIFNDGSNEDYSQLESIIKPYNYIRYIKLKKNIGINKIRNIFLKKISNEQESYFFTLSDDDFLLESSLSKMSDIIIEQKSENWYCFNVISKSKEIEKNSDYKEKFFIKYEDFQKNYLGDKHFVIARKAVNNIKYPIFFKNGYEHIFYKKIARKHNILVYPLSVKVIQYMSDGLTMSDLYSNTNYFKNIIKSFKHVCEDYSDFSYWVYFFKSFLNIKCLLKTLGLKRFIFW